MRDVCPTRREVYCQSSPSALLTPPHSASPFQKSKSSKESRRKLKSVKYRVKKMGLTSIRQPRNAREAANTAAAAAANREMAMEVMVMQVPSPKDVPREENNSTVNHPSMAPSSDQSRINTSSSDSRLSGMKGQVGIFESEIQGLYEMLHVEKTHRCNLAQHLESVMTTLDQLISQNENTEETLGETRLKLETVESQLEESQMKLHESNGLAASAEMQLMEEIATNERVKTECHKIGEEVHNLSSILRQKDECIQGMLKEMDEQKKNFNEKLKAAELGQEKAEIRRKEAENAVAVGEAQSKVHKEEQLEKIRALEEQLLDRDSTNHGFEKELLEMKQKVAVGAELLGKALFDIEGLAKENAALKESKSTLDYQLGNLQVKYDRLQDWSKVQETIAQNVTTEMVQKETCMEEYRQIIAKQQLQMVTQLREIRDQERAIQELTKTSHPSEAIIFCIDLSGSMAEREIGTAGKIETAAEICNKIVSSISLKNPSAHVGVLGHNSCFDDTVTTIRELQRLNPIPETIIFDSILSPWCGGGDELDSALEHTKSMFAAFKDVYPGVPHRVICVGDGEINWQHTNLYIQQEMEGIVIQYIVIPEISQDPPPSAGQALELFDCSETTLQSAELIGPVDEESRNRNYALRKEWKE